MTSPSQEHLLGYLLGALEPLEIEQLEREVASDPRLGKQLDQLARCLEPLECHRHQDGPSAGLAVRTCQVIFEQAADPVSPARTGVAAAMSPEYAGEAAANRWSLADFVVAAGVFLAAGMLFFPAIANSRSMAHRAQCENNLRVVARDMIEDASHHPRGEFYAMPAAGPESFAGMIPVGLKERGYLTRPEVLLCPGAPEAAQRGQDFIPSRQQIVSATPEELAQLQRQAGGTLAFPLGYGDVENFTLGKNLARENRVLVADAPSGQAPRLISLHHDGKGQNVAFESGRTAYVCGCGEAECGDAIYVDRNDMVRRGRDADDNVVAGSQMVPFPEFLPVFRQN